jgi:hypothetical protein
MNDEFEKVRNYLDKYVFDGLKNLNNGFDAASIKYFSEEDFKIVLDRVREQGLGITGIEPWKDGEFYGVVTYEMVTDMPTDPDWYMHAFEDFRKEGVNLQYAASYFVPEMLLNVS